MKKKPENKTISVSVRLEPEYLELIYVINALSGGAMTDADVIRVSVKEKYDRDCKKDGAMAETLRQRAAKAIAEKMKK
nr:hypothetical protein HAGR004_01520 [Bdellovibrio sp. HAGR004]